MGSVEENYKLWSGIDGDLKTELAAKVNTTLECAVCSEIMYVPFTLACGHSFCYDCLTTWFENKLNCPTCRFDLEHPPVHNIHLKEISKVMTDLMIQCIDKDEAQKIQDQRSAALKNYDYDLKNNKLFADIFKLSSTTLIDRSDGVPRCGNCHWEAHGSVCLHCGTRFRIERTDSYYDSEDGDAYNEDDEEIVLYGRENGDDDRYDSEDSFVDDRSIMEINNSPNLEHSDDGLSASASSTSSPRDRMEWRGFDNHSENEDSDSQASDRVELDSQALQRALDMFHDEHVEQELDSEDEGITERRRRRIAIDDDDSE